MHRYIPCAACWWPKAPLRRSHPGGRTMAEAIPPPACWWWVSAHLAEGQQRDRSAQVIPERSRFGSLLLINHRPSSLCHSATNEPSANVYLDGETTLYTLHPTKMSQESHNQIDFDEGSIPHYQLCTQDAESPRPAKQLTLWCTCF